MRLASKIITWSLLAACAAPLASCTFLDSFVPKNGEKTDVLDRTKNLTVDDFRNLSVIDKDKLSDEEPTASAALGIPPLRTYGLTSSHLPTLVDQAARASSMKANPLPLTSDELTEILTRAL